MTKEKKITIGNRFHEVMKIWNEGIRMSRNGFLSMGQAIHIFKKERLWRYDIEHMPSFKYWVEHSLHISVAQAHRLEQIYREVGEVLKDDAIDIEISKITLLLPYLSDKTDEEKQAMLSMAAGLTVEDIKNNIKEMTGNGDKATDVCEHDDLEMISRCRKCGKWIK
jgi:hypothetical protein